jgi:cytidylate kinase
MGTVVFPTAQFKVFLTASAEQRAQRRYKQLKQKGIESNLSDLITEIAERDERDSNRSVAPLKAAEDALQIDSSAMGIDAVFERVKQFVQAQ